MARVRQAKWGNLTLIFDQHRFWRGYRDGRFYRFLDSPAGVREQQIPVSELLRRIAIPDEQGHYQLEGRERYTDLEEGVEELLGMLVGHLSCWFYPETTAERRKREAFLRRFPSLDEEAGRKEYSAD